MSSGAARHAGLAAVAALLAVTVAPGGSAGAHAQTILNVERLQPEDVRRWHWGIEGSASVSEGNSDYLDLSTGGVVGHRWPGDWLRVFGGLDYRAEEGEKLDSDRHLHVRLNHWLADGWQTFHFAQVQTSHSSLLRRRILVGSGIRRRLIDGRTTLDVGTGAMYEDEHLARDADLGAHPLVSRVSRMANMIVLTHPLTESVRLLGVSYLQPDLSDFDDLRTLVDLSLRIALTENLDLTVQNEWRHDSRPPKDVEPNDFVLSTGFAVSGR